MTNVNAKPVKVSPLGGAGLDGLRLVYATGAKAAQNDTITLSGVKDVVLAQVMITDGTTRSVETFTKTEATPTVIKMTSTTTGTVHVLALVK